MSTDKLIAQIRSTIEHSTKGSVHLTDSITTIPVSNYFDEQRWKDEVDKVFKRLPILVAVSAELKEPNSYKAIEIVGMPLLITRSSDGTARAFVNMCSHRGAMLVEEGTGSARRFACPYHNWTYDQNGSLVGIFKAEDFGEVDLDCLGLTPLPLVERAGLMWVTLSKTAPVDFDSFMAGYDELLGACGFAQMNHFATRKLTGPNWKISFDGYVDFYHLPILHKNTFGTAISPDALFHRVGPHQRVTGPRANWEKLEKMPEEEWPRSALIGGVWSIFPHASIAGFDVLGHKLYQIARLYPGANPEESITHLDFISTAPRTGEFVEAIETQISFLERVVRDEDYATGLRIQRTVRTGAKDVFYFGRNEGGAQYVHGWLDALLGTPDEDLDDLFRRGVSAGRIVNP